MTGRFWIVPLIATLLAAGTSAAFAQNAGSDEAISPHGAVLDGLTLTPTQRRALYIAVLQQKARVPAARVEFAIGAPVSRSVDLAALPDQAGIDTMQFLKYAVVNDDVVVVDSVRMRVVDIIRGNTMP